MVAYQRLSKVLYAIGYATGETQNEVRSRLGLNALTKLDK